MARAALIVGAGPTSPVAGGGGVGAGDETFASADSVLFDFLVFVPGRAEQAIENRHANMKTPTRCPRTNIEPGAGCARPFVSLRVLGGSRILMAWAECIPYDFFFSARALRCLGCTSHAIAMLKTYSATIGAAKMHMFMMSVVGVRMAAMMKITRIE